MAITADQARQRATRALTAEELAERYSEGIRDIERRADLSYYSTDQTVAAEVRGEYIDYLEAQGFTVFLLNHGNDQARNSAPQIITDTLEELVVIWQTYEFSESMMSSVSDTEPDQSSEVPRDFWATNPTQNYATVDIKVTSGFRVGQELYWQNRGTLVAGDFQGNQNSGTVVLDELGEAQVLIDIKTGIDKIGKTAIIDITWDEDHTAVLYSTGPITVRSNTA